MLKITVNHQQIDSTGLKFNLNARSTFPFTPDDNKIEGSFVFNGRLPASDTNKAIFGHPHRIENAYPSNSEQQCSLSFDGRLWYEGLISITSTSNKWYFFDLKLGFGHYSSVIQNKSLKDLAFGDPISMGSTTQDVLDHTNAKVSQSYPTTLYNFPMIYAPHFYGEEKEENPNWLEFINHYRPTSGGFNANSFTEVDLYNFYNLVPMLYLTEAAKLCFESFGYEAFGSFLHDPEIKKLLLFNNYALDLKKRKYFVKASQTATQRIDNSATLQVNDDSSGDNEDADNSYDTSLYEYIIATVGLHYIHVKLEAMRIDFFEPTIFQINIMEGANELYSQNHTITDTNTWEVIESSFETSFDNTYVGKKLHIQIKCILGFSMGSTIGDVKNGNITYENRSYSNLNQYAKEIDLANHVPDVRISDFLNAIQSAFGLVFAFNQQGRYVEIRFIKDILSQLIKDDLTENTALSLKKITFAARPGYALNFQWSSSDQSTEDNFKEIDQDDYIGEFAIFTDLPYPYKEGKIAYVKSVNQYFIYNKPEGEGFYWRFHSDNHPDHIISDGEKDVQPNLSPLLMHLYTPTKDIYPKVLQQGTSIVFDLDNKVNLRIVSYQGLQPKADATGSYPLASSCRYDAQGNSVGTLELRFGGQNGLYETFLKEYFTWLTEIKQQVDFTKHFTSGEINNLDLLNIYRIFNANYLIKSAKIPVANDRIGLVDLECYKL